MNIERALRQAVSPCELRDQSKALKPSPCPVAVSAFHNNRNGEPPDM